MAGCFMEIDRQRMAAIAEGAACTVDERLQAWCWEAFTLAFDMQKSPVYCIVDHQRGITDASAELDRIIHQHQVSHISTVGRFALYDVNARRFTIIVTTPDVNIPEGAFVVDMRFDPQSSFLQVEDAVYEQETPHQRATYIR